jgi:hypothetical protein
MVTIDEMVAKAIGQVTEGRHIIERQRQQIAKLGVRQDRVDLLRNLERSLEVFENDLKRLLKQRNQIRDVLFYWVR